jgi:hypothetical protein
VCVILTLIAFVINSTISRSNYIDELAKQDIHGKITDSTARKRPLQRILVKNNNDSLKEYFINLMIPYLLKDDSVSKIANSDSMNFFRKENGEYKLIYTFIVEPL